MKHIVLTLIKQEHISDITNHILINTTQQETTKMNTMKSLFWKKTDHFDHRLYEYGNPSSHYIGITLISSMKRQNVFLTGIHHNKCLLQISM
jgi:hypothetical protein